MTKRKRRVGQSYTAKPNLEEYDTPPASEVVVKNLAGDVVRTEKAKEPTVPKRRKRKR